MRGDCLVITPPTFYPLVGRESLFRPYNQNRTWRVSHHTLGDATQESALYSSAPVTADHDQVRWPFLRCLNDLRSSASDGNELQNGRMWRQVLAEIADQLFRFLFGQGKQFVRRDASVRGITQRRINDMDERHLGPECARKFRTYIGCTDRHR